MTRPELVRPVFTINKFNLVDNFHHFRYIVENQTLFYF